MTTTELERKSGAGYTTEQLDQGIMALALNNGSPRGAARWLEAQGIEIPHRTLQDWKTQHAARLAEAEKRCNDEIWGRTERKFRQTVDEAQDAGLDAIAATHQAIEANDPKAANTWSNTAKNLTIVTGIGAEKAAGIAGRPMHHIDIPGLHDIIGKLERYPGVLKVNRSVVDSTATELPEPAHIPESAPADSHHSSPAGTQTNSAA